MLNRMALGGWRMRACDVSRSAGFTLLELLLVLAVVGILSALAVGQYSRHLASSQRRAAIAALYAGQQMLERTRLQSGAYQALSSAQLARLMDQGQNYVVRAQVSDGGYVLTASPVSAEVEDECQVLSITHSDARGVSGSGSVAACWQ